MLQLEEEPDLTQLVGLNDPVDKEWNERRATSSQRPKSALHERRQQLKEMKQQYLQKSNTHETIVRNMVPTIPVPHNNELAYQFSQALDKFKEQNTRDSGIAQCQNLIEKNRNLVGIYTLLDCLYASSKKSFNPQTNSYNVLSTDLELITLGEIIKQNPESNKMLDKICLITKKHMNSQIETTIQAIGYVYMQLIDDIDQIIHILSQTLLDKSRQVQSVHIMCLLCYYLKQQQKQDKLQIIANKIIEVLQKIMIHSLEFMVCIEFILIQNIIPIDYNLIIIRLLKYCRVPINTNSTFYLIVAQVCKIIAFIGTKTKLGAEEVIPEMEKLQNDRRVAVQTAAKQALNAWKTGVTQQVNQVNYEQKIAYSQVPYSQYKNKGFQSQLRASQFIRKNSRSPSLPKQNRQTSPKIREKLRKYSAHSPKFQMLSEEIENERRKTTLQKLNSKFNQENLEDSLETDFIHHPVTIHKDELIENQIIEDATDPNLGDSLISKKQLQMPSIPHLDDLPSLKQSLKQKNTLNSQKSLSIPIASQELIRKPSNCDIQPQESVYQVNQKNQYSSPDLDNQIKVSSKRSIELNKKRNSQDQQYQKINLNQQRVQADNQVVTNNIEENDIQLDEEFPIKPFLPTPQPMKEVHCYETSFTQLPDVVSRNNGISLEEQDISYEQKVQDKRVPEQINELKGNYVQLQNKKVATALESKQIETEIVSIQNSEQDLQLDDSITLNNNINNNNNNNDNDKDKDKETKIQNNTNGNQQSGLNNKNSNQQSRQYNKNEHQQTWQNNKNDNQKQEQNTVDSIIDSKQFMDYKMSQNLQENSKNEFQFPTEKIDQIKYFNSALLVENLNDAYSMVLDNCDDLYVLRFMMLTEFQISKLSSRTITKMIQFMQKMQKSEIMNVIGLNLFRQVGDCNFFEEMSQESLQLSKEVLYQISGSEQEIIGMGAVNIYNQIEQEQ